MHTEQEHPWKRALLEGAVEGTIASVLSAAVLLAQGKRQDGHAAAPVNAIAHWIWPREALQDDAPSWRRTLSGYLIHNGAAIFWGVLHARIWGTREEAKEPVAALTGAALASGVACFADYQLTPDRFTPGYEHRLSTGALVGVYAAFAVGLAAGSMAFRRR